MDEAVRTAALGVEPNGKRHFHQRRLGKDVLQQAATKLLRATKDIRACTSFDSLLETVERLTMRLRGFGELARYVYARILTSASHMADFADSEIDRFWALPEHVRLARWGAPFDITGVR